MPLQVSDLNTLEEYADSSPSARVYYRKENDKLTIVAGMLSWVGTLLPEAMEEWTKWLTEKKAIEVKTFREIRELFA